jgi:hypothetical protein
MSNVVRRGEAVFAAHCSNRLTLSRDQKEKSGRSQDASDIVIVESVAEGDSNGLQRQLKVRIREN